MILSVRDDFDLEKIADSGQCFRWKRQADTKTVRILHASSCLYITPLGIDRYELTCSSEEYELIMNYRQLPAKIQSLVKEMCSLRISVDN